MDEIEIKEALRKVREAMDSLKDARQALEALLPDAWPKTGRVRQPRNEMPPEEDKAGSKGCCWDRWHGHWKVRAVVSGRGKHVGNYKTLSEAKAAYAAAIAQNEVA